MSFASLRRDYLRNGLNEADLDVEPGTQLRRWLDEAVAAGVPDATAMVLATATLDGHPSARVVLVKGIDVSGLTFFTNYLSRKGRELTANPRAAATFFWPELERQVRAEGAVRAIAASDSDEYFRSRPRDSQLAAWVSEQSEVVVGGRKKLEERLEMIRARYPDGIVPRPPHWGGYKLEPFAVEFWQGRPGRLHDRLRYELEFGVPRVWRIDRLAP